MKKKRPLTGVGDIRFISPIKTSTNLNRSTGGNQCSTVTYVRFPQIKLGFQYYFRDNKQTRVYVDTQVNHAIW